MAMKKAEFEAYVKDMGTRLDKLKALFDQYFQGFERIPPMRQREKFQRELRQLMREQPRNTAAKFQYQTLRQRYTTLSTYWDRILRQIEEGTYHRDVQRLKRKKRRMAERKQQAAIELDVDVDDFDLDAEIASALDAIHGDSPAPLEGEKTDPNFQVPGFGSMGSASAPKTGAAAPPPVDVDDFVRSQPVTGTFGRPQEPTFRRPSEAPRQASVAPSAPERQDMPPPTPLGQSGAKSIPPPLPPKPPPRPMKRPPPPPTGRRRAAPKKDMDDGQLRSIYESYVAARRKNNERTDNVKFESVAKTIRKQLPKLQQKHKGKKIGFEVVVKDGRVGLKPKVE